VGGGPRSEQVYGQNGCYEVEGVVVAALPNAMFASRWTPPARNTTFLLTFPEMRKYYIRILPGDTVTVEMSPYDLTRGRIVFRR